MTPKQITKFREEHFPAKNISTSRLKMAVEFRTTERTIRAYESGENISIPGIFVKAMELWLENKPNELTENQIEMYQNDYKICKTVDSVVDLIESQYHEFAEDIINLVKFKHREVRLHKLGFFKDSHKH